MKISRIYQQSHPPYIYLKLDSGKEYRIWAIHSRSYGIIERSKFTHHIDQRKSLRSLILFIESQSNKKEKTKSVITQLTSRLRELGEIAARLRKGVIHWRDYDLWKEINNHRWKKSGQPARLAFQWHQLQAKKDKTFQYKHKLLKQGFLYTYRYLTPKYADVLDFFDTEPLVISFGEIDTSLGKRDIGVNLHLLPRNLRAIVMYKIFELNRNYFKEQIFKRPQKPIPITWKQIKKPLEKYGIGFAIRMYIPELRKETVEFPFENWRDAIYIESREYKKKTIEQIEILWKKFVRESNLKGLNESWIRS